MAVFFAASLTTFTTTAHSENFNYIVPAPVDGGNAKWAQQVTKQWNKFLKKYGHTVSLRYIKQQNGKKALTEFATTYKNDHTVLLQPKGIIRWITTSGGWKGYDPKNNVPIAGHLNGTFVFAKTKLPDIPATHVGGGAETILDVMAMVVMICGPMELSEILQCQKEKLRLVYGWNGSGQRRKAYLSNDIQITRDGFAHMRKTYKDELKSGKTKVWFSHGMIDSKLGMIADPNSPHTFFDKVYYKKWNKMWAMKLDLDEPICIMDIDVILVNDYKKVFEYPVNRGQFVAMPGWWRDTKKGGYYINGGFFKYYPKDCKYIYDKFMSNVNGWQRHYIDNGVTNGPVNGEQYFVEDSVNERLDLITLPNEWFTRWVTGTDINYGKSMFKWNVQLTRKYRELTGNEYVCLGDEFHPDIKFVHFTHRMNKPHEWEHYKENV